jgi:hypothetical protein
VLPVLHEGDEPKFDENGPPSLTFEAKNESFLCTWRLSQAGQLTSLVLVLRSSSSNSQPQFPHANSKIGIITPGGITIADLGGFLAQISTKVLDKLLSTRLHVSLLFAAVAI